MNHIYKVVFNKATGTFVAVAEYAKGQGKKSTGSAVKPKSSSVFKISALVLGVCTALGMSMPAMAGPTDDVECLDNSGVAGNNNETVLPEMRPTDPNDYTGVRSEVACGNNAKALMRGGVAIGQNTYVYTPTRLYANTQLLQTSDGGVAVGMGAIAIGDNVTSPYGSATDGQYKPGATPTAVGAFSEAYGDGTVTFGENSFAAGRAPIAIGSQTVADRTQVRPGAVATSDNPTEDINEVFSLQIDATGATKDIDVHGYTTVYAPDYADSASKQAIADTIQGDYAALSVGNAKKRPEYLKDGVTEDPKYTQLPFTRQIVNVTAGSADTDAVNVAQLKAVSNVAEAADKDTYFHVNESNAPAPLVTSNKGKVDETAGASGATSLAAGLNAQATEASSSAIGFNAQASGDSSIAIGKGAQASEIRSIAIGRSSEATEDGSIAIGNEADAKGNVSTALGNSAKASATHSTAFGNAAQATGSYSTSVGTSSEANGTQSTSTGASSKVDGSFSSSYGSQNNIASNYSTAVGTGNTVNGLASTAVGKGNTIEGAASSATGRDNVVKNAKTMVLGNYVTTTQNNSVILGNASTDRAATTENSGTITTTDITDGNGNTDITYGDFAGAGSRAKGVVSVGKAEDATDPNNVIAGNERQLINVAAGKVSSDSTDAINGSQLYSVTKTLVDTGINIDADNGTADNVNLSETIKYTSTDTNITTTVADNQIDFSLANSITVGDTTANNSSPITIDGGNGTITGLENTLPDATTTTVNTQVPTINDESTVATVGDVLNAGFNLNNNNAAKDFIQAYDTVDFIDGEGTKAVVETTDTTSTVTYNVQTDDTLTVNGDNEISVNTGDITSNPTTGIAATPDTNTIATTGDVVDAVNNSGFKAIAGAVDSGTTTGNPALEKIANGDTVTLQAGDNMVLDQNGSIFTYSVNDTPVFKTITATESVTIGDATDSAASTVLTSGADGLDVGGDKITDVAAGDISDTSTDAINGSQLNDTNTNVAKGFNVGDGSTDTNYQLGDTVNLTEADGNITTTTTATGVEFGLANQISVGTVNPVTINGDDGTVGGLTNTTYNPNNIVTGQAATEDQLEDVAAASQEKVTSDDGSIEVIETTDATTKAKTFDVSVNTDNATITKDADGNITANTTELTHDSNGSIITPTESDALVTAGSVAEAINNSGFTAKANGDAGEIINPGDEVNFIDGDNIAITRDGTNFTIATAKNVTFDSITAGPVVINNAGINAGDTVITNVADGVDPSDAVNVSQLNNTNTTVAKGLNIAADNGIDDNVKLGETVTYTSGDNNIITTVSDNQIDFGLANTITIGNGTPNQIIIDGDAGTVGSLTNTTYDPNTIVTGQAATEDQLQQATAASQEKVTSDDGSIEVTEVTDATTQAKTFDVSVNTDGTTITKDADGNITANTTELTPDSNGSIITPTEPNTLVTVGSVANAINNSGFTVQANGDTGEVVNPGDNVDFIDGDNIDITREGTNFTIATAKDVTFDSITAGPVVINNAGINAGETVITNVADGVDPSDAVNVSQLNSSVAAAKTEVVAGTNVTDVSTSTGDDGQTIYTVNAEGTTASAGSDAVTVKAAAPDAENVTDYVVDLSADTKTSLNSADSALQTVVTQIDGSEIKTLTKDANTANFVTGDNIVLSDDGNGGIKVATAKDVTFDSVTADTVIADNVTAGNVAADNMTVDNVADAPNAVTNKQYVDEGRTGVTSNNGTVTVVKTTSDNGNVYDLSIDAQGAANNAQLPVAYTDAQGNKVYKQPDGSFNTAINGAGDTVAVGDVVTSLNGANDDTQTPTVLTNVAGNLEGAAPNTTAPTTTADAPVDVNNNNAATVGDVLNSGFNLQSNGEDVDFVRAYDSVNFVDGVGTQVVTSTDGATNTVQYDVKTDNKTVVINSNGEVAVNTTPITSTGGVATTSDPEALATSGDITDAVNNSGFTVTANNETGGEVINPGDNVNFVAGDNIKIDRDGSNFTITTTADVTAVGGIQVDGENKGKGDTIVNGQGTTVTVSDEGEVQVNSPLAYVNDGNFADTSTPSDTVALVGTTNPDGTKNPVRVQNVAPGQAPTDAVNVSQLNDLGYAINNRIDGIAEDANSGVSSAMAMAALPQAYIPGKSMVTGGMATYNGEGAVAVGLSMLSDNGKWVFKISGSADTAGNAGAAAGAGFHF